MKTNRIRTRPKFKVTPVFARNYNSTKKIVVNRGGTRSSKTYSLSQLAANWLITGWIRKNDHLPRGLMSIVRKHGTTLRATVERDFIGILQDTKLEGTTKSLYDIVDHHKTNRTITYGPRMVEFFGADDQQKIRGRGRDILYCNEANDLGFQTEFFQLNVRTKHCTFIDFNPSDPYVWINEEIEQKRARLKGDIDVIVSTYKDNPFLSKAMIEEIEYLKETDAELWEVYGKGNYGKVEGLVFPKVKVVKGFPAGLKRQSYCMDFGYTNDPTAIYRCGLMNEKDLYIDELVYETGLMNPEIVNYLKYHKVEKSAEIIADSAEPKSIAEICARGFNCIPAEKGPDSIRAGIQLLKQYNIHISQRSVGLLREQKKYKWKEKDGQLLTVPIDMFNHGWDAVRYYALKKLIGFIRKRSKRRATII